MRPIHLMPALAALAFTLAACGSSADEELADEALSMDDVLAQAEDNGITPQPGLYRSTQELLELSVEGFSDEDLAPLRAEFAAGADMNNDYCVTAEMTRDQLFSAMTDNSCTVSRLGADGDQFSIAMTCSEEEGPQNRIEMAGTVGETSSDMELTTTQMLPELGDATIRMRVRSERVGECS